MIRTITNFLKALNFSNRFFALLFGLTLFNILAYFWPNILRLTLFFLAVLVVASMIDIYRLFRLKKPIKASREMAEKLSNGDQNQIFLTIDSAYPFPIQANIIDELPVQLQQRHFNVTLDIEPNHSKLITYRIEPKQRGIFMFRHLNVFTQSQFPGLIKRKISLFEPEITKVYPSIIQMKKWEFLAISNQLRDYGIKKLRRIGQSQEFEQIRDYVIGDDYRTINWKATGRSNKLMVNQFIDERSQRVYCIIDKGRVMKMPFDQLTLLDYAINSTLALSNVVLKHHNKAGLITFSKTIDSFIPAEKKSSQINVLLNQLYAQKTQFAESDYQNLFLQINKQLRQRSLLLFFTNFETRNALYRQLKYLRQLAKKHVLVVLFFENTELTKLVQSKPTDVEAFYDKTIAMKFNYDKQFIVNELAQHGIHAVLTKPQDLTVNTINKYLELRSRGLVN